MPNVKARLFMVRTLGLAFAWIVTATFTGCGGAGPTVPLYPTTGQVLVQGRPAEGVQVTFRPVAGDGKDTTGPTPIALTDKDGKFRVATSVGADGQALDGAPAGDYMIALVLHRSDSNDFLKKTAGTPTPKSIDPNFANPNTSGLRVTIKPGENTLEAFKVTEDSSAATGRSINRD